MAVVVSVPTYGECFHLLRKKHVLPVIQHLFQKFLKKAPLPRINYPNEAKTTCFPTSVSLVPINRKTRETRENLKDGP